jgi:hypothetical protein
MGEGEIDLISDQTRQALNRLYCDLSGEQATLLDQMTDEILANISVYAKMSNYLKPIKKVEGIFFKKAVHYSPDDQVILKRALVAKLVLHLPHLLKNMDLPDSILALYPDAFERLAAFLKSVGNDLYNSTSEFFCKDVRFVLGLSIPCGVLIVDMNSRIALRSVILSGFRSRKVNGIIKYFLARGNEPWFRGHVDSRYLKGFNETGNDNFYLRVAELMERQKGISGYVGTSWYFDPQLLEISPRLAYLQERPRRGGAFFLRHGTEQSDIVMAVKTSETRRRLYQDGKYIPVCYSMLWPRKELIAWAEQKKT